LTEQGSDLVVVEMMQEQVSQDQVHRAGILDPTEDIALTDPYFPAQLFKTTDRLFRYQPLPVHDFQMRTPRGGTDLLSQPKHNRAISAPELNKGAETARI
jgi:hypothetical protein